MARLFLTAGTVCACWLVLLRNSILLHSSGREPAWLLRYLSQPKRLNRREGFARQGPFVP